MSQRVNTISERREKMKKIAVILAVVWLMAVAPDYGHCLGYGTGNVEVDVVSEQGEALNTIPYKNYEGDGTRVIKKYLEAKKGRNYSIIVTNSSPERVGVVVAVDGRNVINGRKSYLKSDEVMYIINPYDRTKIDGWRTDDKTIHQFYFTDPGDSYSVRTFADSSAMGVIAVAVFREKDRYRYPGERSLQNAPAPYRGAGAGKDAAAGAPFPGERKMARSEAAGTGFGDEHYSPIIRVEFEPEQIALSRTLIKYEWRETLCGKGILRCGHPERNRLWDEGSYAPFPPGYWFSTVPQ